jgi:hypothetical protein
MLRHGTRRSTMPTRRIVEYSCRDFPIAEFHSPAYPAIERAGGERVAFAESWNRNFRRICKIGGMSGNFGCFRSSPRHHLRYQAANNPRILSWRACR